ncbi:MAG: molybdopterin-dependent oxidoreductase [Mailhella sp.]|nr:molybdopterin-dependent oxidoreductase [Mailhella sp.]
MDRRGFLKFAAGSTVGLVASPIIWNTLYDAVYWTQNWGWVPRLKRSASEYIPTVSKLCPSGTGFVARIVQGTPVRTLADENNAISKGAVTALATAEAELRVSPARLKTPLVRSADGVYKAIGWEEAEGILKAKFAEAGRSVAAISGDPTSSINEVISGILKAQGSSDFYFMPDEEQPALRAWEAMGGKGRIGYDIENSDCVLSVGSPLLESWGVVAANRSAFDRTHPVGKEATQKIVYASPVQNNTAAGADLWLPIKPGTEMALLLGVANLLIKAGKPAKENGLAQFAAFAAKYSPEKTSEITGVPVERLQAAARMLAAAQKPLVIAGSALGSGGSAGPVMAAVAVNMLLGSVNREGGLVELPFPAPVVKGAAQYKAVMKKSLVDYMQNVASERKKAPALLLVYAANPVYALPVDSGAKETVQKAGYSIAVASFLSETCAECDLILPAALGMEAFDDVQTPYGAGQITYAFARPVAKPFGSARPAGELFLALAQELGIKLGVKDMPDLLYKHAYALGAPFRGMIEEGKVHVAPVKSNAKLVCNSAAIATAAEAVCPEGDLQLAPVVVLGMGTAQTGIPPFATKIITNHQLVGKLSAAQMNGATAKKLKVAEGDKIKLVAANKQEITARVVVFEGVMPDTVSLVAGLGHTAFDQFSQNKGSNVVTLTSISREPGTNLPVWGLAGVKAVKA